MKYAILSILFLLNNEILSLACLSVLMLMAFADLARERMQK